EVKLAKLKQARDLLRNEAIAEAIEDALVDESQDGISTRDAGSTFSAEENVMQVQEVVLPIIKSAKFELDRQFFIKRNNEWSNTSEIAEAVHMQTHSIRQMIYSRYVNLFEKRDDPKNSDRKQYRLSANAGLLSTTSTNGAQK